MAISDNRTKTVPLAKLIDKKFISAVDKTKAAVPNAVSNASSAAVAASSKISAAAGKKNIFDKSQICNNI